MNESMCPVCREALVPPFRVHHDTTVSCPNCGNFRLLLSAAGLLSGERFSEGSRPLIAHALRKRNDVGDVSDAFLESVLTSTILPGALERIDNIVVHLATTAEPGEPRNLVASHMRATIGTRSVAEAMWALRQALEMGYINGRQVEYLERVNFEIQDATLQTQGWARYQALVKDGARSRHAFMAMKFNDPELDAIFAHHFKPAVKQTGFDLRKLDESPSAGLIDNRMRVEIRTSRFLVCDLSHGNKGAYWEAGFAEGLGRPVIYLCRDDVFTNDHEHRPHFDTNHHAIIKWNAANPSVAARSLKDMIRATLPGEAHMEDVTV